MHCVQQGNGGKGDHRHANGARRHGDQLATKHLGTSRPNESESVSETGRIGVSAPRDSQVARGFPLVFVMLTIASRVKRTFGSSSASLY